MSDNNILAENNDDTMRISDMLKCSWENKWIQDFVYLLRKFFYIEYWSVREENENEIIQIIQNLLKEYLDFLNREIEKVLK